MLRTRLFRAFAPGFMLHQVILSVIFCCVVLRLSSVEVGTSSQATGQIVHHWSYGSGGMMTADPFGGYWTVTDVGSVTPHQGAPSLGDIAKTPP